MKSTWTKNEDYMKIGLVLGVCEWVCDSKP